MNNIRTAIIRPVLMGAGGMILSYFFMLVSAPITIIAGILYGIMGIVLGVLQPRSLWYAPLILLAPLAAVFIPMGMQVYFFLYPVVAAFTAAYLGMFAGAWWQRWQEGVVRDPEVAKRRKEQFRNFSTRYLLPFGLSFVGMFLYLFSMFIGYQLGLKFPLYIVAYPLIYAAMGALLALNNPHWLSTAIILCLLPVFYGVVIQLFQPGPDYQEGRSDGETVMLFVMIGTFLATALSGYLTARIRGRRFGGMAKGG